MVPLNYSPLAIEPPGLWRTFRIDECGVHRAMTLRCGRSRRGTRCYGEAPLEKGRNQTLLGALSPEGISACLQIEGATTADIFSAFIEQMLVPTLRPGQVGLLDNLPAHKHSRVEEMAHRRRRR